MGCSLKDQGVGQERCCVGEMPDMPFGGRDSGDRNGDHRHGDQRRQEADLAGRGGMV